MAKSFEIKKKKKVKSWLSRTMLFKVLPAYLAFVAVLFGVLIALLLCNLSETSYKVAAIVLIILFFAASVNVFAIIPLCRAKQAMLDFENYDFSPYTAQETETFSQTVPTEKYYFTPSPFDDDEGIVEISDIDAYYDYFSQFAPERLKRVEELSESGKIVPFNIFDLSNEYCNGTVEKRKEGEYVTVTVTEKPTVTFAHDGVHLGEKNFPYEKTFPYEQCEAQIFASFVQVYACVCVSVNIVLSDLCAVNFTFGTRIMSIIDKHKITVKNRELADFILADPKRAFKLIGLKRKISENKLRRQRCNNRSGVI